ncbi:hypothetical protein HYN59_13425 [Flavobacterium album]|uniref:Uncharacterized protein n=1 Tax=Flavobacterium album TaxID=2175091 RepID=A0A2S1R062_9FLAO|nr:hypothetical protein [Flavobacterium album]AWH86050.1 hypothetical protein HYN59_13425 [Flavobacterium album]
MKNIAVIAMLAMGLMLHAQVNKNVTKESTTTTVTVNNGTGTPKKVVKTQNTEAIQNIELQDANSNKLNKDVKQTPVEVNSSTTVSGDGIPTYYETNGQRYIFVPDRNGYKVSSSTNVNDFGVMRKTSNGQYIYHSKDKTAIGYIDANGNFVVESYDDKSDGVTVETYTKVRQ